MNVYKQCAKIAFKISKILKKWTKICIFFPTRVLAISRQNARGREGKDPSLIAFGNFIVLSALETLLKLKKLFLEPRTDAARTPIPRRHCIFLCASSPIKEGKDPSLIAFGNFIFFSALKTLLKLKKLFLEPWTDAGRTLIPRRHRIFRHASDLIKEGRNPRYRIRESLRTLYARTSDEPRRGKSRNATWCEIRLNPSESDAPQGRQNSIRRFFAKSARRARDIEFHASCRA